VASSCAVEAIDVFEERLCRLLACLPRVTPDEFGLQRFEEGLDGSIVLAIAFTTHGCLEPQLAKPLLIIV
jgi:hypothetical protein